MTDCFCCLASTNLLLSCLFSFGNVFEVNTLPREVASGRGFTRSWGYTKKLRPRTATFGLRIPVGCRRLSGSVFCHLGGASDIQFANGLRFQCELVRRNKCLTQFEQPYGFRYMPSLGKKQRLKVF